MSVFLWVVLAALAMALFGFTVYAFAEGGLGIVSGARFERCPRCGRHGLVTQGRIHIDGCPHPSNRRRLRHLWAVGQDRLHLG